MDKEKIAELLENVRSENIEISEALEIIKALPYKDLGYAKIDTHRDLRKGFPEVIFCEGKSLEQIRGIIRHLSDKNRVVMGTRATQEIFQTIREVRPDCKYYEKARIVVIGKEPEANSKRKILVISAGTSDIPVAEEAAVTARMMGNCVETLYDVGVAGIHRLLSQIETLFSADVIIVVAGMDGALPSVVGGLVDKPIIAVPTSIGYGASFRGVAALLTMLNSCAPGVTVVNIDNGFGAGYSASLIALR